MPVLHQQAKQTKFDITVIVVSCTQRFPSAYIYIYIYIYIYTRTKRGTFDVERIQACVTRVLYNTRVPSYDHERYIVHGISVSNRSDSTKKERKREIDRERERERKGRDRSSTLHRSETRLHSSSFSPLLLLFLLLTPACQLQLGLISTRKREIAIGAQTCIATASTSLSPLPVDFPYGFATGCRIAKRFVFERYTLVWRSCNGTFDRGDTREGDTTQSDFNLFELCLKRDLENLKKKERKRGVV